MREFNKMAVKLVKQILLLCLFNIFVAENMALHGCSNAKKNKVACFCGERPNVEVKIFEMQPEFFYNKSKDCQQVSIEICASHSCLFKSNEEFNSGVDVEKYAFRDYSKINLSFPPLDDDAEESHRDRRSLRKCSIPHVDHASMNCYVWGELYSCDIKCNFGYAFEEDGKMMVEAKRECRESKSVWLPKNSFPLCKAHINCKAVLIKPGNLECSPGPGNPYCDISCKMDYKNGNGEVPMERYECVDEHFAEILPHCATLEKNADMLKLSGSRQKSTPKSG